MALTTAGIGNLEVTGKDYVAWDRPGFGVRVKPSGAKSYLVQYRNRHGQNRRMTIARVGDLPLSKARKEAERLLANAKLEGDPAAERNADRRSPTVRALAEQWIEKHSIDEKTRREYRRQLHSDILPVIGSKKLRSLSQADVRRLYLSIADSGRGPLANRVLATVSSMLSWATERGIVAANPARGIRRKAKVEKADTRTLSAEEVHRFLKACQTLRGEGGYPGRMAACFELILLTGIRPSDAYRLRWEQIDWDAGLIRFGAGEQKADHVLPAYLRGPSQALLRSLEADKADDVYVFPSRRLKGQPVTDARKVWARVEDLAKFNTDANPKHLRKTHSTLGLNWGHDMTLISKSARHTNTGITEKHYAFVGDERVAAAEDEIQVRIAALVNDKADVRRIQ